MKTIRRVVLAGTFAAACVVIDGRLAAAVEEFCLTPPMLLGSSRDNKVGVCRITNADESCVMEVHTIDVIDTDGKRIQLGLPQRLPPLATYEPQQFTRSQLSGVGLTPGRYACVFEVTTCRVGRVRAAFIEAEGNRREVTAEGDRTEAVCNTRQ